MVVPKIIKINKPIADIKRRMVELRRRDFRIDEFGYNIYSYREIMSDDRGYRVAGIITIEAVDSDTTACTVVLSNNNENSLGNDWGTVIRARIDSIIDRIIAPPQTAPYKSILSLRESSARAEMSDVLEPFTVEPERKDFLSERTAEFMYRVPKAGEKLKKAEQDLKKRGEQVNALREQSKANANSVIEANRKRQSDAADNRAAQRNKPTQSNSNYGGSTPAATREVEANRSARISGNAHDSGAACKDDHLYKKDATGKPLSGANAPSPKSKSGTSVNDLFKF